MKITARRMLFTAAVGVIAGLGITGPASAGAPAMQPGHHHHHHHHHNGRHHHGDDDDCWWEDGFIICEDAAN